MGVDIHMNVVLGKKIVAKSIFDGRNSEWFDNLQLNNYDNEYDYLNIRFGFSPQIPDDMKKEGSDQFYYGHHYFNVGEFLSWFQKYRPDRDAGWVTTYDKWRIENKGYVPEDVQHFLYKEDNREDMHFVEFINPYDCSGWLYKYLINNNIDREADVTYWFDC